MLRLMEAIDVSQRSGFWSDRCKREEVSALNLASRPSLIKAPGEPANCFISPETRSKRHETKTTASRKPVR
jgi:hypothetical protein